MKTEKLPTIVPTRTTITKAEVVAQIHMGRMIQITPRLYADIHQAYGNCVPVDSIMRVTDQQNGIELTHGRWSYVMPLDTVVDAIIAEYSRLENL